MYRRLLTTAALIAALALLLPPAARAQSSAPPPAAATPIPAASAAPVDAEDPAVTAIVKDLLQRLQTRTFDRGCLEPDYSRAVSDASLARTEVLIAELGEPRRFDFIGKVVRSDAAAYAYHITLARGTLDLVLILDGDMKIADIVFGMQMGAPAES